MMQFLNNTGLTFLGIILIVFYLPILLLWVITRQKIEWRLIHFLFPVISFAAWFLSFFSMSSSFLNRGKSESNLAVEPFILAALLAVLFLAAIMCKRLADLRFLFIGLIIILVALMYLIPPLPI